MALWGQGDPRWIVEDRPDSTNVNNWHWTERDATTWSKNKLKQLFSKLKNCTAEGAWKIDEVNSVTGEATINNRKGKLIYFYEWKLTLKYSGTLGTRSQKHYGTITIPNLSDENEAEDIDVQIMASGGSSNDEKMKNVVRREGIGLCRNLCQKYVDDLKAEYSKGMVLETKKVNAITEPTKNNNVKKLNSKKKMNTHLKKSLLKSAKDSKLSAFACAGCTLESVSGGEFSLLSGDVTGSYVLLYPGKKLLPCWRFKDWPPEVYSMLSVEFEEKSTGTELKLLQAGMDDVVKTGWIMYLWQPIRQLFRFLI